MAMLIEIMYDSGWVIDEYITGSILLVDVQIAIVILFVLVGLIIGVLRRR